jgi:hypothetical protein
MSTAGAVNLRISSISHKMMPALLAAGLMFPVPGTASVPSARATSAQPAAATSVGRDASQDAAASRERRRRLRVDDGCPVLPAPEQPVSRGLTCGSGDTGPSR